MQQFLQTLVLYELFFFYIQCPTTYTFIFIWSYLLTIIRIEERNQFRNVEHVFTRLFQYSVPRKAKV